MTDYYTTPKKLVKLNSETGKIDWEVTGEQVDELKQELEAAKKATKEHRAILKNIMSEVFALSDLVEKYSDRFTEMERE